MLQRLRRGLSYSNVTATLALTIAMGGSAYALTKGEVRSEHIANNAVKSRHIAKNAAKGSDVKESSLKGIGTGLLGGEWADLSGPGNGGIALAATGTGAGSSALWVTAPVDMKIADFTVRLLNGPQTQGTRKFLLQRIDEIGAPTIELCTIQSGEESCSASSGVKIPKGLSFRFWVSRTDSPPVTDASYGWRAITR